MKTLGFHKIITEHNQILKIQFENHKEYENSKMECTNNKNHENYKLHARIIIIMKIIEFNSIIINNIKI